MKRARDTYKQVIAVRTDIGMSVGKIAAQAAHASVGALELARGTDEANHWLDAGGLKVVVAICGDDVAPLMSRAFNMSVLAYIVRDAGRTEVPAGTVTCLAFGPGKASRIDRITGDLRLL